MTDSEKSSAIKLLGKALAENNHREALALARERLRSDSFQEAYHRLFWEGLERALARKEEEAIVTKILHDYSPEQVKKLLEELTQKQKELLIRDPAQTDLSQFYLQKWASLLSYYCQFCE
ncbi:MAG: hypothetical protein U9O98_07640 [Asgard group archaeon]|nr:hypothetical protein [Asgard group archaeon]